jgi:hypothetical protein
MITSETWKDISGIQFEKMVKPGNYKFLNPDEAEVAKHIVKTVSNLHELKLELQLKPEELVLLENKGQFDILSIIKTIESAGGLQLGRILITQ